MNTRLKDGGVFIDWASLTDIKAWIYSDAQKAIAGRCDVSINLADSTKLVCVYSASKPQYLGVQRLIVQARYMGQTKTYDKPVFNFVRWTADQAGEQITIDDPEVDVEIVAEDISSSILDEAIRAALAAAEHAEHAASLVPLQVLQDCEEATRVALTAASKAPQIGQNGNWWTWDAAHEQYVDTGKVARGPRGNGIASWSVAESQEDDGENVVTVTFNDGDVETFTVKNGKTGNGIASIVQTVVSQEDAGTNEITVTMTDGTVVTFNVKNGSKGQPGAAQAAYKSVETLPEPSAATMDKIYLTPSGTADVYNMSYTDFDGANYSWVSLGTTSIQLSDYATKTEFNRLEHEVDYLQGKVLPWVDNVPSAWDSGEQLGVRMFAKVSGYVKSTTYAAKLIPVNSGDVVEAYGNASLKVFIAVLNTYPNLSSSSTQQYPLATGDSNNFIELAVGTTNHASVTCPSDALYIMVAIGTDASNQTPSALSINGVDAFTSQTAGLPMMEEAIADMEEAIADNTEDIAAISAAVFPQVRSWTDVSDVNNAIAELYIPNASTELGTGAKITTLVVNDNMVRIEIQDGSSNRLVFFTKKFTTYVTNVADGSRDDYFRSGAISIIYKIDGNLRKRIGYVKFFDTTYASSSISANIDLSMVADPANSPSIKKMVNDTRQIVIFGDSHPSAFKSNNLFVDILQGLTGIKVFNLSFGGCDMAWRSEDGSNAYDPLSFSSLVDSLVSQSFTAQRTAAWLSDDYVDTEADLEAVDVTKPMQAIVEFVLNDFTGARPIGDVWADDGTFSPSDSSAVTEKLASLNRSTMLGALNYGLLKLYANYPKLVQVQVTGGGRVIDAADSQGRRMRSNKQNTLGLTLDDYNAALKENCDYTGVRWADYPNNGIYNVFAIRFDNNGGTGITVNGSIHNEPRGYAMMAQYWASIVAVYYP